MRKTIEKRLRALEDREELIKLKARYVNYNDGGWQGPTHTDTGAVPLENQAYRKIEANARPAARQCSPSRER